MISILYSFMATVYNTQNKRTFLRNVQWICLSSFRCAFAPFRRIFELNLAEWSIRADLFDYHSVIWRKYLTIAHITVGVFFCLPPEEKEAFSLQWFAKFDIEQYNEFVVFVNHVATHKNVAFYFRAAVWNVTQTHIHNGRCNCSTSNNAIAYKR